MGDLLRSDLGVVDWLIATIGITTLLIAALLATAVILMRSDDPDVER